MIVTEQQIIHFWDAFRGRADVHGTYDLRTGRAWQVKRPITPKEISAHILGQRPLGVYLLDQTHTCSVVADFDEDRSRPPKHFRNLAESWGLPVYIERSKSKGYHVWMFFEATGVPAVQCRLVFQEIIRRIGCPATEIFPKQDRLESPDQYGNFINLPLFGRLVPQGRTVFLDDDMRSLRDQWELLSNLERVSEEDLNRVIQEKGLDRPRHSSSLREMRFTRRIRRSLPPCAEKMLRQGVTDYQRVACFRLACQLRKIGTPFEKAIPILLAWAEKNRPGNGKRIILPREVYSQARSAYQGRKYLSNGCEDPAVQPFCDPRCPILRENQESMRERNE